MRICEKHQKRFINDIKEEADLYAVDGAVSNLMLLYADGDTFNWNPNLLAKTIDLHGGCPICFLDNPQEDFYKKVVEVVNNHQYRIGM